MWKNFLPHMDYQEQCPAMGKWYMQTVKTKTVYRIFKVIHVLMFKASYLIYESYSNSALKVIKIIFSPSNSVQTLSSYSYGTQFIIPSSSEKRVFILSLVFTMKSDLRYSRAQKSLYILFIVKVLRPRKILHTYLCILLVPPHTHTYTCIPLSSDTHPRLNSAFSPNTKWYLSLHI